MPIVEFILLAAIWGGSFLLMKISVAEFGPFTTAFLRCTLAALLLLPLLAWRGQLASAWRYRKPLFWVGIFNSAIPFAFFAYAMQRVPSGMGGILNATAPLWTTLLGALFFGQKATRTVLVGLALGFVGVLMISWPKLHLAGSQQHVVALGLLACLGATFCYGLSANLTRKWLGTSITPLQNAACTLAASSLFLLPLALRYHPSVMPSAQAWLAVLAVAAICSALAYVLYFRIIARMGATAAVSVTFVIPVFALAYGALFMHEPITLWMLAGGAVIVAGTALVTGVLKWPALGKSV